MPLITVYITNYNYGDYIQECVESILLQTFQDFEIIIIDDGSTDNSKEIIEKFASFEKISIVYQQNKGLNVTNNIALRLSKGKYIMRLDADDYVVPNMLELMVDQLEQDKELGLVFPDYFLVNKAGEITDEVRRYNFDEEVTLLDLPAHGACTMIRSEFLKQLGGYDENYKCQDGYELWIKFTARYKISNLNTPLFYYRQHGSNLTSNELRILNTRKEIKKNFVAKEKLNIPDTLAIIPVRRSKIGDVNFYKAKIGNRSILEIKIDQLSKAKNVKDIVVTSEDSNVGEWLKVNYPDIKFIRRSEEIARYNVGLSETVKNVFSNLNGVDYASFMLVALEYPFVNSDVFDEAIDTMVIFKAAGVLSVRADQSTFFKHDGQGMKPIENLENVTKLERDSLFKYCGGVTLCSMENFNEHGKVVYKAMSHVVLEKYSALVIESKFDLEVMNALVDAKLIVLDD